MPALRCAISAFISAFILALYLDTWPSDARTAATFGLDATLFARRAPTDARIDIRIGSPEGFTLRTTDSHGIRTGSPS